MADPAQPQFPQAQLQGLTGSVPALNTAFGGQAFYNPFVQGGQIMTPQRPDYAVPPPSMHGGPVPFPTGMMGQIFSGHPSTLNPGVVGFQGQQQLQISQQQSLAAMGLNFGANLALGMLTKGTPAGDAISGGMIPFQGISGSRMDFQLGRHRQNIADSLYTNGIDGGIAGRAMNPDLAFFGGAGIANNGIFQSGLGHFSGFRTRFDAAIGQFGGAFGGSPMDRAQGSLRFFNALQGAATREGGGIDYMMTQGADYGELQNNIYAAFRRKALGVTSRDIKEISDLSAAGRTDEAQAAARRIGSDVSKVVALGKDVFGRDASADQILGNVEQIFGREGVTNAGEASNRLRQIEAAGQALNIDSQSVAKYMQVMKQMTRNVGLIGESGTDASLGMMIQTEETVRFGGRNDINVDRSRVQEVANERLQRNLLSEDAKEKNVLSNILNSMGKDALAGQTLRVNGRQMTGLEVLNRMNRGLSNTDMSNAERRKFEQFMRGAVDAVNNGQGTLGRFVAGELRQRVGFYDAGNEEAFAQAQGRNSYNKFVAESGIDLNSLNVYDEALGRYREQITAGMDSRQNYVIEQSGGLKRFMGQLMESGAFTAYQSEGMSGMKRRIRASIEDRVNADLDRRGITDPAERAKRLEQEVASAATAAVNVGTVMARYRDQTFEDSMNTIAYVEQSRNRGNTVRGELDATTEMLETFERTAGGMPTESKDLVRRAFESAMREMNQGKGSGSIGERVARFLGDATGAKGVAEFAGVMQGSITATQEDGSEMTFGQMMEQVKDIMGGTGKVAQKRKKAKELKDRFWKGIGDKMEKMGVGGLLDEVEGAIDGVKDEAQDASDKSGESPGKKTALGDSLTGAAMEAFKGLQEAMNSANEHLQQIVANTQKTVSTEI